MASNNITGFNTHNLEMKSSNNAHDVCQKNVDKLPVYNFAMPKAMRLELDANNITHFLKFVDQFALSIVKHFESLPSKIIAYQFDERKSELEITNSLTSIVNVLELMTSYPELSTSVGRNVLRDLFSATIKAFVDFKDKIVHLEELTNKILVVLIKRCDHTNVLCALITLLNECIEKSLALREISMSEKGVCTVERECDPREELTMKCIWKLIRIMESQFKKLEFEKVLHDCHVFLKMYPEEFWNSLKWDTPFNTVLTVVTFLIKHCGKSIFNYLTLVRFTEKSDFNLYDYVKSKLSFKRRPSQLQQFYNLLDTEKDAELCLQFENTFEVSENYVKKSCHLKVVDEKVNRLVSYKFSNGSEFTYPMDFDISESCNTPRYDATPFECVEFLKSYATIQQIEESEVLFKDPNYLRKFCDDINTPISNNLEEECELIVKHALIEFEQLEKYYIADNSPDI